MIIYKIKIYSEGGQGVKSAIEILKEQLSKRFFITTVIKYDSIVKGGIVETNILFSNQKIISPFIDTPDLLIALTKNVDPKKISAKEKIVLENFNKQSREKLNNIILEKVNNLF